VSKTVNELAREALGVQDASNLPGVLLGFHKAACDLRDTLDTGNAAFRRHPVMVLWLDKVRDLIGADLTPKAVNDAWDECKKLADEEG
jgi:hypothetical protein